jgi:hypothetical protein
MKYRPYTHEALKKAVIGALGPAHMDLTRLMGWQHPPDGADTQFAPLEPVTASRMALVAALGMGIRSGGLFSREEIVALQRVAVKGDKPAMQALRAMQATRPVDRTKYLGVLLWRMKYGSEQGVEVFMAAAHLLALELRKQSKDKRRISPTYIAVMQCALTEWLHDRCGECTGTGQTGRSRKHVGRNHPALYTCASCGGTGAYEPGAQQRAAALRMDVEAFIAKWERRYDGVLATLQRVDRKAGRAIDRQARGLYADATDRSREQ